LPTLAASPLVLGAIAFGLASTAFAAEPSLIYEAQFNDANRILLQDGAGLGNNGSGVSGQPNDKAYSSKGLIPQPGETGPIAVLTGDPRIDANDLTEFTVTAWYKPNENLRNDVVLYNGFGSLIIWEAKTKQWVLRVGAKFTDDLPHMYWFPSGGHPPGESWANANQWTYIAMVWKKSENKVTFYQGSPTLATTEAKVSERKDPVDVVGEGEKPKRTVGGDIVKRDRAFDGLIDDVRFFAKALDSNTLEKIRQADLKNAPTGLQ
jgi:hypothetical protein